MRLFFLSTTLALALTIPVPAASDSPAPAVSAMTVDAEDAVPVPETIGAAFLAAIGFLLMFRRRRLS